MSISVRDPGFRAVLALFGGLLLVCAACDSEPGRHRETPSDAQRIADRFLELVKGRKPGPFGVERAVFLKPHGCARGRFVVEKYLPTRLRVGLFAKAVEKPMWVRVSSDTVRGTPDSNKNTIGFAVKVMDVPGTKVLAGEEHFETQDFLMQNHHVFFVDTAHDFMEFTEAIFLNKLPQYFAEHPTTKQILDDMDKNVGNVLRIRYFSTTPYQFGDEHAKYSLKPCVDGPDEALPAPLEPNYLRTRFERDMKAGGACMQLQVQLREGEMPLDRATVEWSEEVSKPVTVARLHFDEPQDVKALDKECDGLSMTAWHALEAHRPVGSVNEARGFVYKTLADFRRTKNNIPIAEPTPKKEEGP